MKSSFKEGDKFSQFDDVSKKTIHRIIDKIDYYLIQHNKGKAKNRKVFHFITEPKTYKVVLRGVEREYEYLGFGLTGQQLNDMVASKSLVPVVTIKREKKNIKL